MNFGTLKLVKLNSYRLKLFVMKRTRYEQELKFDVEKPPRAISLQKQTAMPTQLVIEYKQNYASMQKELEGLKLANMEMLYQLGAKDAEIKRVYELLSGAQHQLESERELRMMYEKQHNEQLASIRESLRMIGESIHRSSDAVSWVPELSPTESDTF